MAGATPEHNQLSHNISRHVGNQLVPRGCRVMQSDQRVQLGRCYVYPDVVAFCEEGRYTDQHPPSLLNPELVVEVLFESTMEKDMTWKLSAYQEMPPIRELWLVHAGRVRIDQYARTDSEDGNEWTLRYLEDEKATLRSEAFDLELSVEELYELVL